MTGTLTQLSGPGVSGREDGPPMFQIKFTEKEFNEFLADPPAILKKLGHPIDHLNVSVGSSAWVSHDKKWVETSKLSHDLRARAIYICGYCDAQCFCYRIC